MKQVWSITKLNLKLLWRQKIIQILSVTLPLIAVGTFFVLASNPDLSEDLRYRTLYSYSTAYSLLNLIALFLACFVTRTQIDAKNIHALSSFPLSRLKIFFGEFLALFILLASVNFLIVIAQYASSSFYEAKSSEELSTKTQKRIKPDLPTVEDLTKKQLKKANIAWESLSEEDFLAYQDQVRRAFQRIKKGEARYWNFNPIVLPKDLEQGLKLSFTFNGRSRSGKVKGKILIKYSDEVKEVPFEAIPLRETVVELSKDIFKNDEKFKIGIMHENSSELIVSYNKSISLFYEDSTHFVNGIKSYFLQLCHLSILVLIGMWAGTAFSFTVAGLLSLIIYLLSFGDFFTDSLQYINPEKMSQLEIYSFYLLEYLVMATKGIQAPDVITDFAARVSLDMDVYLSSLIPSYFMCFVIFSLIGGTLLKRKELDKIQA